MKKHLLITSILLLGALVSQAQWQPDVRLTNDPGMSSTIANSNAHCIATSGDTVHVVWSDNRNGGNYEIYYKRSTDGGVSWGPDTRISNNVYSSENPSISVSGSVVHVVWDDIDAECFISYNRSTDGGTSWGTDTRLANVLTYAWGTSVSASGSEVHIVWTDNRDGGFGIYYKRSTDGGVSWGADTRLTAGSWGASVSASGLLVHVIWLDGRNGYQNVSYKRSTDGGLNWGADTQLTNNDSTRLANDPSVAVSGSNVHVIWMDSPRETNTYEIYYKHSTDGGITWGAGTQLTTNYTSETLFSTISASGSNVHVVWDDNRNSAANYEIYYKGSTDGGQSWGTDTRLTNNSSVSAYPFVASSNSGVHVVWQDYRDGNYEIYYKRNPINSEVGLKELSTSGLQFAVFPNPTSSEIKVRSLENINELTIIDMFGKEIYHTQVLNLTPELRIPTSDFPSGIYFIQVKKGNRISVRKFIKL